MPIDQQNDNEWKDLMKQKRDVLEEWREVINKWINESDGMERVVLRKQVGEISNKLAQLDKKLDEYVNSKGGY